MKETELNKGDKIGYFRVFRNSNNDDVLERETEIKEKLKIARQIVKELESDLVRNDAKERLELRKIYNERLGIYKEISYFKVVKK